MKRIAIISEHASPIVPVGGIDSGGQNVYVAKVAQGLAAKGWRVDVFTRRESEHLPRIVEWSRGVRVIHVPAGPPEPVPKETLLPHMPAFLRFMREFIHREKISYDLVHANFWMSGQVAMGLKESPGLPFVITFHALGKIRRIHQGNHDLFPDERFEIECRIVEEAEAIIAECPQERLDLETLYEALSEKITVIPCGFDPQEMWPVEKKRARKKIGVKPEERVLLVLGRMAPRKGVDNAIRGFAHMVHRHHVDGKLVIVGGDSANAGEIASPEIHRLAEVAQAEAVADRVEFTGRRERNQLRYYYSAADVFITTPSYEPFGITPLEAMACRTAVVASEVGGLKSTVRNGETGCLVPPGEPEQLGACLAELFQEPDRLHHYADAGRKLAMERYQWAHVVDALERVYDRVSGPPGRPGKGRAGAWDAVPAAKAAGQLKLTPLSRK